MHCRSFIVDAPAALSLQFMIIIHEPAGDLRRIQLVRCVQADRLPPYVPAERPLMTSRLLCLHFSTMLRGSTVVTDPMHESAVTGSTLSHYWRGRPLGKTGRQLCNVSLGNCRLSSVMPQSSQPYFIPAAASSNQVLHHRNCMYVLPGYQCNTKTLARAAH
jgi:hypothetical protein